MQDFSCLIIDHNGFAGPGMHIPCGCISLVDIVCGGVSFTLRNGFAYLSLVPTALL
jgi:hypothetical protein